VGPALLELKNPQQSTRRVKLRAKDLDLVMARRLKGDVRDVAQQDAKKGLSWNPMPVGEGNNTGQSLYAARRYAEAVPLLIAAARAAPDNQSLWRQAILAASRTGAHAQAADLAQQALLHHPQSDWTWRQLGSELTVVDRLPEAEEALRQAKRLNPEAPFLWRHMASLCRKQKDLEGEIRALTNLVAMEDADSNDLNQLGIAHYNHRNMAQALVFYRLAAAIDMNPSALFNMGLAFNDPEISQDADAADAYRRVLSVDPSNKRAPERLEATKRKLVPLAAAARPLATNLLQPSELFRFYVNPFELLQLSPPDANGDLDIKAVQRAKKRLLQEIELNDGAVSWLDNCHIDRSRALEAEDALHNVTLRKYHCEVFGNTPLLHFLTRGDIGHFLYSDSYFPCTTIERIEEDEEFLGFLSEPFARQYNLLLSRAIERKLLPVVEALFDGRRWVRPEDEDVCFEGAFKRIGAVVELMRQTTAQGATRRVALSELLALFEKHSIPEIFNLLPTPFASAQRDLVSSIRSLAIACFNEHRDSELSKSVLALCNRFQFRSVELTDRLKEDYKTIEQLIAEERQHEYFLKFGAKRLVAITKDGIRDGDTFIPAESVAAVRWGATITRGAGDDVYDFLVSAKDGGGKSITVTWQSQGAGATEQRERFSLMIRAALRYIAEDLIARLRTRILSGPPVVIGVCTLDRSGVAFQTQGFIFKKDRQLRWSDVVAETQNGDIVVRSRSQAGVACTLSSRDIDNAVLLPILVSMMTQA
jgi:tetratricopeptide (TPR) repeat protein